MTTPNLFEALKIFPFIAITRGILPTEAAACASLFVAAGFPIIETPLNSPEPFLSIRAMVEALGDKAIIGAGTVSRPQEVDRVREAGGRIIVSPHCDPELIKYTKHCGLLSIPGVATPSEAFCALGAGADGLKLFPAESIPPSAVKALRAVLPRETLLLPVGSITSENWQVYMQAGANGFGLGSSLYTSDTPAEKLRQRAQDFASSWYRYQQEGV
jgi:2-dehydro-3-deoxyphosphogalactonate aldolase